MHVSCICDRVLIYIHPYIKCVLVLLCSVFSQLLLFGICPVCVQYLSSEYLSSICDRQVWCSEEGPLIWPSYKVSARQQPATDLLPQLQTHLLLHTIPCMQFISCISRLYFLYFSYLFLIFLMSSCHSSRLTYYTQFLAWIYFSGFCISVFLQFFSIGLSLWWTQKEPRRLWSNLIDSKRLLKTVI